MPHTPQTKAISGREYAAQVSRYSQYGLALGRPILRALEKRGIHCLSSVSIEHQHLAKRYVLRGTESGGAVSDMGRYCAFLDVVGNPLNWLQPIDSISGNGRHAVVISPDLVRIDMLRVGRTYDLAITRHSLSQHEEHKRPVVSSSLLFIGHQGTLAVELWKEQHRRLRGSVTPIFYSPAGETRSLPEPFLEGIRKITGAVSCIGCKHAHLAIPCAPRSAAGTEVPYGSM